MEKDDYMDGMEDLTAEQLAEGILNGIVTFEELRSEAIKSDKYFGAEKQRKVKTILKEKETEIVDVLEKEDREVYISADNLHELEDYILKFPNGKHVSEAQSRIQKLRNEKVKFFELQKDINKYTPGELNDLSNQDLDILCKDLSIDSSVVRGYKSPILKFNDIPETSDHIPSGYTDVFFWGIPSSGKTCALSAILSTIKKNYTMEAPDTDIKFGVNYRGCLINMFRTDIGYLPEVGTTPDKTQYMPFLLYKRGEKHKRKVSFFEKSGEAFRLFYEKANNCIIINESEREALEKSFETFELLLNSGNQKIHFFFIDYNHETEHIDDKYGLTQSDYLEAAATYFRDRNDIFKKKTDAVYVVITKSDEIKGDDVSEAAKTFLSKNFGSFMDVLKNQCDRYDVDFKVKLFSIGDVYFKKICKINRSYSEGIIQDLLVRVKPDKGGVFGKIFNS